MISEKKPASGAVLFQPVFMVSLGLTFLAFSLPIYAKQLGASALEIGGLFSIFTVTTLVVRPLIGLGLDRFGRKFFFIAGLSSYALAMLLFAQAASLGGLYLARLVNGLAAALTWIATCTMVADLAPAAKRGRAIGLVTEMESRGELVGAAAGIILMSMLPSATAWPLIFSGYALMAAASALMAWRRVPETRPAVLIAEKKAAKPVSRMFGWLLVIIFTSAFAQSMLSPIYLVYLQEKFTIDPGTLGMAFFPAGIIFAFLPAYLGNLSDRFGRVPFMVMGLLGAGLLYLFLPALPNLAWLTVLYALAAVGWAMSLPAETAMVADLTGQDERGRAYGLYEFMGSLGAVFGPLIGGALYDSLGKAFPFYLVGGILLFSAAWVLLVLRQQREPEPVTAAD